MIINKSLLKLVDIYVIKIEESFTYSTNLLSTTEMNEINSLLFRKDQLLLFTSRIVQKYFITYLCGMTIDDVLIKKNTYGKPIIIYSNGNKVKYSVSYGLDIVVLSILNNKNYEIGVDVEFIDFDFNYKDILPSICLTHERNLIKNHTDFYKIWTKKESLMKSIGVGFVDENYKRTQLTLNDYEYDYNYLIYTFKLKNHIISVCLYKS